MPTAWESPKLNRQNTKCLYMTRRETTMALLAQKSQIEEQLLALPNVLAVAVGYRYSGGKRTRQQVISVHVERKTDDIASEHRIPSRINGIRTDVIELAFDTHPLHLPLSRSLTGSDATLDIARYGTIQGGIAIGLSQAHTVSSQDGQKLSVYEPGTLGAVVFDRATQQPLLLSNYHVLAASGFHSNAPVMQPSPGDKGNSQTDVVAKLKRAVYNEWADCAVAALTDQRPYQTAIVGIGAINGAATAYIGAAVRKRGRTTQLTYGTIEQVGLTVKAQFMGKPFVFRDQLLVRVNPLRSIAFAAHGDSGAVVVDSQNNIIGLLSLIGKDGQTAVVNPISAVMQALDISIAAPAHALLPALPLRFRAKGQRVRQLQAALNRHGYTPALAIDVVFGKRLVAAVQWFQQRKGLNPDGIVGQGTWQALGLV